MNPTVMEPLRADWVAVQASALILTDQSRQKDALNLVKAFHRRICAIRVLAPACGSGNFL
ncbi:DNA methyltransferase [Loktanella sp. M215]|uniref:DNA methyltransferase n=1 Tax=Loktanella sp. M215 TaxID=2675431 RepID=UPI001F3BF746|nr:DNA methyltransferase [Loktanella sp. M215]